MKNKTYTLTSEVTLYPGMGGWHFGHLDKKISTEIKDSQKNIVRRGFGSVKVQITIGKTTWNTSIFPSKKTETYLFPIKKSVRRDETIFSGDIITFSLRLI